MTEQDIDRQLKALLFEPPPPPDPAFAERILALAAYDQQLYAARRRALGRLAGEIGAMLAVLGAFALLASLPSTSAAELSRTVPLSSPAMLGVALLGLWALVAGRDPASA